MAKKYAVIDIGTLKVKFLIATITPDGVLVKEYASNTLTCFGCDMVGDNVLEENLTRTIAELKRCHKKLSEFNVTSYRVVSTHAMRRAKNKDEVMRRIFGETGFEVENLSSEEEAHLFFWAVLRDFPTDRRYALVDMGGGSVQIIIGQRDRLEEMYLLPIGSATLYEKFNCDSQLETSFNTPEDIDRMRSFILAQLMPIPHYLNVPIIYGSTNVVDMMQAIDLAA